MKTMFKRNKLNVDTQHKEHNSNNITVNTSNGPSLFDIGLMLGEIKKDNDIIKRDIAALKKDFNFWKKGKK